MRSRFYVIDSILDTFTFKFNDIIKLKLNRQVIYIYIFKTIPSMNINLLIVSVYVSYQYTLH